MEEGRSTEEADECAVLVILHISLKNNTFDIKLLMDVYSPYCLFMYLFVL